MTPLLLSAVMAAADSHRHLSTVHDGVGGISDNTVLLNGVAYRHASAGAQPGGIQTSASGVYGHSAGFLHAVDIKKPGYDHDHDGVPDELDEDNDNDGLTDLAEVLGSSFSPVTPSLVNEADSDQDGVNDGQEAGAGTNPLDPDSHLRITDLERSGNDTIVSWQARSNKTYKVRFDTNLLDVVFFTNVLGQTTATGFAPPPWYELIHSHPDPTGGTNWRFYMIEVVP